MRPARRRRRWHRFEVVATAPVIHGSSWGFFSTRRAAQAFCQAGEDVFPGATFFFRRLPTRSRP